MDLKTTLQMSWFIRLSRNTSETLKKELTILNKNNIKKLLTSLLKTVSLNMTSNVLLEFLSIPAISNYSQELLNSWMSINSSMHYFLISSVLTFLSEELSFRLSQSNFASQTNVIHIFIQSLRPNTSIFFKSCMLRETLKMPQDWSMNVLKAIEKKLLILWH